MANKNQQNDNKYHQRSQAARKSTLVSVVVNLFYRPGKLSPACFQGRKGLLPMASTLFPI